MKKNPNESNCDFVSRCQREIGISAVQTIFTSYGQSHGLKRGLTFPQMVEALEAHTATSTTPPPASPAPVVTAPQSTAAPVPPPAPKEPELHGRALVIARTRSGLASIGRKSLSPLT
jgi:hypothetical protein